MRYDDPARPRSEQGARLQLSLAALPVVVLLEPGEVSGSWLACIHAQRAGGARANRYGYHSAMLDLAAFAADWLESPEGALEKHFGYKGLEETAGGERTNARGAAAAPHAILTDLWKD